MKHIGEIVGEIMDGLEAWFDYEREDDVDLFQKVCKAKGFDVPDVEFQFVKDRKWRFDYAWPDRKVALEVEGGVWTQGRHTRGSGFVKDMTKYNRAAREGWLVFRTVPKELMSADTFDMLAHALKERAA